MDEPLTVRANGITLAYRVRGPEDGPPVLLLHRRGVDSTDWTRTAGALAAAHRVYALDLRGHGGSDWPGQYSYELMRDDVRDFLAALGITRTDIVGHSLGGVVAYLLAQDHPRLIRRLVLEDVPAPLRTTSPRTVPEHAEEEPSFDHRMVLATERARNSPDPSWWARMDRITLPVLAVAGGHSSGVPQDGVAALARRIPGCRLVTVEAGHLVHARRPAEFLAEVGPFLGVPWKVATS
ncbi:alpha/beta fold hydrolase [Streptomyces tsukubensis]|uniref:Alpha/beta hydrolase n=1 Tax=Streptomyces tsukubensis TaxID=83656 RepID=A0A1V4A6U4_9ACTN|nr:alpha/beta fold hydrolase [Streptomyces tsukubensis]OON77978.1 alpha/beta hydrolase [Streptomyces tsukubensis]QFR97142.1 alpha/beta fold hydrolase [Streptomyces tsukubensis]